MISHGASTRVRRGSIAVAWAMLAGTVVVAVLPPATVSAVGPYTVDVTTDGADANLADGVCQSTAGECTFRAAIQQALAFSASDVSIGFSVSGPFQLDTDLTAEVPEGQSVSIGSPGADWSTEGLGVLRLFGFHMGGNGGVDNKSSCAFNEAITGLVGWQSPDGPWLRAVQPVCRPIVGGPGSVGLGAATNAAVFGDPTGAAPGPSTVECPTGSVVTGFGGRNGALIDQLELYCAPLNLDGTVGSSLLATGTLGGTGGFQFAPVSCPTGTLANGISGRTGDDIDRFGLRCFGRVFTVNNIGDGADQTPGNGFCATSGGVCTLRAAIQEANASFGYDRIGFGFTDVTGVLTIAPVTPLPAITAPVLIDGYTQTGTQPNTNPFPESLNAVLRIQLSGAGAASGTGLVLAATAGGSVVRGLIINGFSGPGAAGVRLGTRATIEGNYIGTNAAGSAAAANHYGVLVGDGSDSGIIGGASPASRNLISGNVNDGVYAYDPISGPSSNLTVQGNFIGTDATGTLPVPNLSGVCPCSTGGHTTIKDNLLSGNRASGIWMQGPDAVILGNLIGVNRTGTAALPNGQAGIFLGGSTRVTIGDGTVPGRNVIAGNAGVPLGQNAGAIYGFFNGSGDSGIRGNYIGVGVDGVTPIGNSRGIDITTATGSPGVVHIGGQSPGEGNVIANSTLGDGVRLSGGQGSTPVRIVGNRIYDNVGLGINLGAGANDPGDADTGPNLRQNSPEITAEVFDGQVEVRFTIDSTESSSTYPFQIDIYAADDATSGEGQTFLGRTTGIVPPGPHRVIIGEVGTAGLNVGEPIVATATDGAGNTSEFSNVALITDGDPDIPLALDVSLSIACECDSSFVVGAEGVPVRDFDRKATEVASSSTIAASSISAIGPADTSLAAITIGSTPLRAIVLGSTPLRAISLVDVDVDGGWSTLLAGTELVNQPLSTLTLGDAFDNPAVSTRLATTPLRAIDVNGTPLSAIPLAAIALGSTPLSAIGLPDDGTGVNPWCAILADVLAITGESCAQALTQNLMALSLRGASLSPAPLRAIPLRAIPLEATDLAAAPLRAIELQDTNLAASPLRAIPLRAIDLLATNPAAAPLRAIPLSAIPLRAIPLSASTLNPADVAVNSELIEVTTSITLSATPLRAIDASGTPLSAIQVQGAPLAEVPLSAIVLADTPLRAIALDGVLPGDSDAAWCALLADAGAGFDCTSGADPATTTLRDISVHGVPLRAIPLRAIDLASINLAAAPLRAIPLSAIPLRAIPLRAIDLDAITVGTTPLRAIPLRAIDVAGSPLSAIPLRAIDVAGSPLRAIELSALPLSAIPLRAIDLQAISVAGSPLRAIPLRAIDVQASPLRAIPLRAIPPTVNINCALVDCTNGTLGDAYAKGAVPATTTLGDIQAATAGIRLGELAPFLTTVTVQELISAIAGTLLTINDLTDFDDMTIGDLPSISTVFDFTTLGDLATYLADITFADLVDALRDQAGADSIRDQIDLLGLTLSDLDSLGDVTIGDLLGDAADPGPALTLADLTPVLGFITLEALENVVGQLTCGVICRAGTVGGLTPEDLGRLTLQDLIGLPEFDGLTIGELLTQLVPDAVLDGFTLGDLLLALLDPASLAKGSVDLRSVDVASLPPAAIDSKRFSAGFRLTAATPQNVTVEIVMPAGAVYVAGSAVVQSAGIPPINQRLEPTISGQTLSWTLTAAPSVQHSVSFDMTAGLRLGPATIAATGRIVGTDIIVPASTPVEVVEGLEPNDFALVTGSRQTTPADPDNVYLTYIANKTDIDVFEIVVPEDGELVVRLSNLDADLDLALWGRPAAGAGAALGPVSAEDPLNPITDPDASGADAEALNDFQRLDALDPTLQLISVSNLAGTNSESIATDRLSAGTYYVQVYGANGAVSANPAALQLKINAAEIPPLCRATDTPFGPGSIPTIPTTIPASANTLILVNESRTEQFYGPAARTAVTDAITRLTTYLTANPQLGLNPMVMPVDGDATVRSAYATWDSLSGACSADAANTVVSRINTLIDQSRAQFEHIVIVGGDELIPMARLSDRTQVANEYDYRHEFDGSLTGVNPNGRNALTSHLWESDILSDEPYGDAAARSLGDRYLYVTDVALGRLVETPAEIVDALDTFVQFRGTLQIDTATVLGYDFLADGSATVASELEASLPGAVDTDLADGFNAVGDPWDRDDAVDAIARARTNALISLNAHFDHYRALPAAGDKVPGFADNLIAEDVANALGNGPDLSQSLVFSMGCHSGLSVSDILIGRTNQDWAQQLAQERALFVGNTGFGYGDTVSVAYTEQLMTLFADQVTSPFDLDPGATVSSSTVGQALAWAKNQYVAGLQTFSVYDEKAVMESTFYGLPFYRVGLATQTLPATPTRQAAPDATGTPASTAIVDALNERVGTTSGTYYRNLVDGVEQTIVAPGRPIQPKTVTDISVVSPADPTALAQVAHGAMVLNMVSDYISLPNPVIATPVFDESSTQPEPEVGDVAFPTKPLEITTSTGPSGQRQQLVLATGQYRSDNGGVQRLDDDIDVVVYYADPDETDFVPPTVGTVESEVVGGRLSLGVTAVDGSVVDRVFVLVAQNPGSGLGKQWTGIDLALTPGTDRWTGSLALSPDTTSVEFIVQAKDQAGNVGFATNKALNFENNLQPAVDLPPPPPAVLSAEANGTAADNGWFAGDVTVTVTTATSAVFSIDGVVSNNLLEDGQSFTITGEGPHTWTVTTSDGRYSLTDTVLIDATGPDVKADPPPGPLSVTSVTLTAVDPGSGPVSLAYTVDRNGTVESTTVPGSTAAVELAATGTTTITARADDFAGNEGALFTFTYTIDTAAPTLTAVLDPEANDAGWNMGPVTVNWLAEDEGVELAPPPSTTLLTETAGTTVTAQSCDLAGNCTTASVVVRVDMTAPDLVVSTSLPGNSFDWNNTSIDVSVACTDALSGVVSCPPPVALTTEGNNQIVSFSAEDVAGNPASATSRTIRIDLTKPVITVNGPADDAIVTGPYTRPTCTATDALSGVGGVCAVEFADPITVVGGYTETATFSARDRAGNLQTVVRTYTVRTDAAGPVINPTANPLSNADGWWNTAVTYSFDCVDSSGVATCPAERTLSAQGANQSFTVTATDVLGTATSLVVAGINIDLTPPVVTVTAPTNVGPADTVTITCAASDALSGIATSVCTDQTFAASTLNPGANVFTFSATDVAGNTTTVTRTITLVVNAAPSVLADMGVAGLNDIGFKSRIVIVTGSFADPEGPGPFTASVQWTAGGPFTQLILNNNTDFVAANIYPSAGARTVTVRICDAGGACGTDTLTVRAAVTQRITPVRECVVDRGAGVSPRYLARWGYNNPASFAIAVPSVPILQNTFTAAPFLRGQPQIFLPGQRRGVFTNTFASGTQTWRLDGTTASAASNSPAC